LTVAVLEERELLDKYGDGYVEYRRDVPRFVPKLRNQTMEAVWL
jgi:protein-S-isoprenylcysteine O-methyltransferase Ste14